MLFRGIVARGEGSGKALGFPTANIPFSDDSISGVYAAKVRFGGSEYNAAVYADVKRRLLEAHILHFSDDLYGTEIEIELLEKMREDKEFTDENDARATISDDVQKAQEYFRVR